MNIKGKAALCIASAVIAGASLKALAAFDADDRAALRIAAEELRVKFKSANALDGKAITVLPVKGDQNGYFERLIVGALVGAGKTCVIGNDEKKDVRFKAILDEIKWDERQKTLNSVDPSTIDELGNLKSTQVFIECRVDVSQGAKRKAREVEAELMAYAIETKQYVWTHVVDARGGADDPVAEETTAVAANNGAVRVRVKMVGDTNAPIARDAAFASICNCLVKSGYAVNGDKEPDAVVEVACCKEEFDRTGEWIIYKGVIRATVNLCGENARSLGVKTVFGNGARGLGEVDAERNLAAKIAEEMPDWAKNSLMLADFGIRTSTVVLKTGKVESADDLAVQREFFKVVKAADGVRSVELVSQDSAAGIFKFRVVFDSGKFGDGLLNEMVSTHPGWELSLAK